MLTEFEQMCTDVSLLLSAHRKQISEPNFVGLVLAVSMSVTDSLFVPSLTGKDVNTPGDHLSEK